jgi:uncharacterized protein (TIGR03067 family)
MLLSMMMAGVALIALSQRAIADDAAEKAELEKFKGTWEFESVSVESQKEPPPAGTEISIDGKTMTITMPEIELKDPDGGNAQPKTAKKRATFQLKINVNPKQIDVTDETDGRQGKVEPGIYEFDGGKLKMCMGKTKGDTDTRPKAFDDKQGALLVLKRKAK